ncbi:cob(I)yrinic acid a,c-diamide adenosyltransferase [Nocardioides jejuensis]|uniref:Cob(I)yrinic acid a,c-diamide adenosyltransferase n=1 Tax=Nocardioides jejuensis TaxID=2502782 RepID=A0A4V2NZL1_9ACTN|nr:cob(I)yrinic acid a,c-diamide adenosyltransferase [Nocardioides jejuensis]TCJ29442.1 cob(I)yrinic acid a,c-diamide adenosyltransferase [Nocardioides jejuensis]
MAKGIPDYIPEDGLTTRQRRNRPLLMVHTGENKGKSTAAFGLGLRGWNQGWNVAVFQFVKSAKWKVGEENAYLALNTIHEQTGQGGPVQWNKMGDGWSWSRKKGEDEDHAQVARDGWEEIKRRILAEEHDLYILDEFAYPVKWGWVSAEEVAEFLKNRPGHQHVVITGRNVAPEIIEVADLVTEMTKIKHPMDNGQKGQKGIEW